MQVMKKISNWTFGSVFRTFGRIIAYLIIGLLITILLSNKKLKLPKLYDLLGIETVSAQTVSKSSDQWATQWCNNPNCGFAVADATYYRDYVNVNTGAYTNSNHYFLRAMRLKMTFNSSNYLQSGTQYQIRYKIWFNPLYTLHNYQLSNDNIDFTVTDSGNNQTQLTEGYNCGFQAINNTTSFFLTCLYTPSASIKQVYVRIRFDSYITIDTNEADDVEIFRMNTVNYTSSSVTYATGDKEAIEQQTTVIQNQTNEIIDKQEEIIDGITSEDSNPESSKCGIICKLKHIVNFLKVDSLINIIIPTQTQLNDLFTQFQTDLTSKLGILGLPVSIYTNIMHIIDNTEENGNWCIEWEDVDVPNFENYTIIEGGSWCFNTILQNNKINALREFAIYFTGALILLAFLQYCKNIYHRILDVPVQEDYVYFTEEDVYTLDKDTGEVTGATHKSRTTHKEVAK